MLLIPGSCAMSRYLNTTLVYGVIIAIVAVVVIAAILVIGGWWLGKTRKNAGERPTAAFPSSHVGVSTICMLLDRKSVV